MECVDRLNSGGNHEDGGVGGPGVNVDDLSNDTNGVGGNEENPTGTDGEGAEETDYMDTGINGERADGSTIIEISITNDMTRGVIADDLIKILYFSDFWAFSGKFTL